MVTKLSTKKHITDGTPCAVKVACTVWTGGKAGDKFKGLPIGIVYGIAITAMSFFTD